MNGPEKVANLLHDMQTKIDRLGSTSQLGNTTIGGDAAVVVADVVTEAVVTNDALPDVQVDAADGNEGVSDLQSNLSASDEDLTARLADAAADLADAAVELLDAQQDVSDAFDQQVEGLSGDVDIAIKAAGNAKTEAEAATGAARDAAGLAASKGETITQVSAPTGSRANPANLWIDNSLNAAGVPKNQPNRYGPVTVPDPNAVAVILPAASAQNETEVMRISVAPGASTPVALTLSVSMALNSLVKSSIGRLRDGLTGAVLASYVFSDKGDSTNGNQETWTLPAGFTATPTASVLVLTIQSNNANSPAVYSLHRTITASSWQAITDQKALDAAAAAATAATAAQTAKTIADQANTAAGVAKQAASDANTQALAAANLAGTKGQVIYQVSAPTGANASAANLWIRTSDNTPWTYDTTNAKWVQVTDKTATDAASKAAQAQLDSTAAANAAKAAQDTANGKPLILFSSTAGPSGTAPTGSIWFLWDTSKNVAGQWLQSGTLAAPVWTPQQIRSEVIANLDVAKLTAGSAAIAELVAQKIAAATGNFQTANVSNLFVTSGATMSQAVIDYLFANVVQAKKITAGMIDATTFNGVTFTGALFKSTASGQRIEMLQTRLDIYNSSDALSGRIFGGLNNGIVTGASLVLQAINGSKSGQFLIAAPLDVSCSVSPAPYVLPGFTYTGTNLKGTISAVAEGLVVKGPLLADEIWYAGDNRRALGPANQSTPNGNRVVLAATVDRLNYAYANGSTGVRTEVPVMTGDPYGDTPNVYLAATDFRTPAGASHGLGDTGWINLTPANGWANQSGTRLRYRVRHGVFYLQGYLNSANATATTFAVIPSNYTPSQNIRVPATNGTGSSGTWMDFPIGADGTLAANTARNPNFAVCWPLEL